MKVVIIAIIRNLLQFLYKIYIIPFDSFFALKSMLGMNKHITLEGLEEISDKICVFVTYPKNPDLSKPLIDYLIHIKNINHSIILVSNAPISDIGMDKLKPICSKIILRDNYGLDFAGYKLAILKYKQELQNVESLIIANDSVIPIKGLEKMYETMSKKNLDVWGITESYDLGMYNNYHICSYFLAISRGTLQSVVFWDFWQNYKISNSRVNVIKNGEINFTVNMLKAGKKIGAYINSTNLYKFLLEHDNETDKYLNCVLINKEEITYSKENSASSITNLLYSTNHTVFFFKAMLMLEIPVVKKDIFSRCRYYISEIAELMDKLNLEDRDEIINELSNNIIHSKGIKDKFLIFIGEK